MACQCNKKFQPATAAGRRPHFPRRTAGLPQPKGRSHLAAPVLPFLSAAIREIPFSASDGEKVADCAADVRCRMRCRALISADRAEGEVSKPSLNSELRTPHFPHHTVATRPPAWFPVGGQPSVIIMMRMRCGHDDYFRMVMETLVAIAVVPTVIVMTSGGGEECKGAGQ